MKIFTNLAFVILAFCCSSLLANELDKHWNLINYNENIEQQGNGITVGIIDTSFSTSHPSLDNKMLGWYGLYNGNTNLEKNAPTIQHGTQVASIILGKNLGGNDMHGLSPNANFYGVTYLHPKSNESDSKFNTEGNIYGFFDTTKVKVINNSWAGSYYPNINKQIDNRSSWFNFTYKELESGAGDKATANFVSQNTDAFLKDLVRLSKQKDILQVFATSNEGFQAPSLEASMPSYDEELRAWIAVGAVNAEWITKQDDKLIFREQKQAQGSYSMHDVNMYYFKGGMSAFSNSFKGSESYGIVSPGEFIYTANSYYGDTTNTSGWTNKNQNKFIEISGTSFATPFVSGAAALVQEKFPFLGGAQIADVLLSTANSNVELPPIVIKVSSIKGTPTQQTSDLYYYYDVIYTDKQYAPTDLSDKAKIKQDLKDKLGYTDDMANTIVNHLMNSNTDGTGGSASIMTKEELIGQGVLDIEKALKGLGKLDANRLNDKNIQTRGNEQQAIYVLDTGNSNAEFSNNISQQTWKSEWHNPNAANAPTQLQNITKIGFEKKGSGELTFNGKNSYEGDTIVSGGSLKIAQSGTLSHSNAFARNGGTLKLSGGIISNTATAESGGFIVFDSTISTISKVISKNGGSIKLENGATLKAANGVENSGTLSGIGTIEGNLQNLGGTILAGFYSDKDSINGSEKLQINGEFSQASGDLRFLFSKDKTNTSLSANSYKISGGSLTYIPAQSATALMKEGDIINLSVDSSLQNSLRSFTKISAASTNTLEFEIDPNDKSKIIVKQKGSAFQPSTGGESGSGSQSGGGFNGNSQSGNSSGTGGGGFNGGGNSNSGQSSTNQDSQPKPSVATALKEMFNRAAKNELSKEYKEVFAKLDKIAPNEYQKAVDSLHETPASASVAALDSVRKTLSTKSVLFLLNPAELSFMPTAALGGDYIYGNQSVDLRGTQISMGATYRHLNHDDFSQNSYLFDIQAKKSIGEQTTLGGFVGFANDNTKQESSKINSNIFNAGLSVSHNLGKFGLLGVFSGGFGANKLDQNTANVANSTNSANYNNYFLHAQGGAFMPLQIAENTSIMPIALLDYTYIYQNEFTQSGGLFARKFEAENFSFMRASVGVNLSHTMDFNGTRVGFGLFGFLWHKFSGEQNQAMSFADAPDLRFSSNAEADKNGFYGGASVLFKGKKFFVNASIADEISSKYNQIELMTRLGIEF